MIRYACYFSLTLILASCGQRKEPPAPVSYGIEDSTPFDDVEPQISKQNSGSMLSYIEPEREIKPTLQEEQVIVVKPQENLAILAERYQIDREEIIARNNLMAPYYLFPGQNLKLPADARARPIPLKKILPQQVQLIDSSKDVSISESDETSIASKKEPASKKDQNRSAEDREKELEDKFSKLEADLKTLSVTKSSKNSEETIENDDTSEKNETVKTPTKKPTSLNAKNKDETSSKETEKSQPPKDLTPEEELKTEISTDKNSETEKEKSKDAKAVSEKISETTSFTLASPLSGNVKDKIISDFNQTTGKLKNDGINLKADKNAPILAAQSGQVVYAGNEMQGFGNLILLKHEGGWMTAYGHCAEILVKEKQFVKQGDTIAKVGNTGSVRDPQLHFQLRKKSTVVDPKLYLE